MNTRFVVAALLGAVSLFVLGFVLWGVLLMDFFQANVITDVMKETPDPFWALIVGHLAYATLLTLVIGVWSGATGAIPAMKTAAVVGLLMAVSVDFTMLATAEILNLTASVVDPLVTTVQSAVTGAVIGWWLGREEAAPAT
jgi:uncharacterized membrane protein